MALKPDKKFGEGDASTIDDAIARSVLAHYVGANNLKPLKGNFQLAKPDQFEFWYKNWGQSSEDTDSVPGFVNRKEKKPIKLRLPNGLKTFATFEAAVHETIHLNWSIPEHFWN
jgi:hypothetical protein